MYQHWWSIKKTLHDNPSDQSALPGYPDSLLTGIFLILGVSLHHNHAQTRYYLNMLSVLKDEKLYYSIGEIADMFGVSKSLIRYWETEFTILKPHKNSKGDRRFTKENIDQLQLIFDLVKNRGFTIEGAKNEIKQNKDLLKQKQTVLQKLVQLKTEMQKMKESLNVGGESQNKG